MQFVGLQFLPKGTQAFLQNSVHLTIEIPNYLGLLIASFDNKTCKSPTVNPDVDIKAFYGQIIL